MELALFSFRVKGGRGRTAAVAIFVVVLDEICFVIFIFLNHVLYFPKVTIYFDPRLPFVQVFEDVCVCVGQAKKEVCLM